MKRYNEGKSLRDQLEAAKKRLSAGLLFKAGCVVLDFRVLDLVEAKEKHIVISENEDWDNGNVEYHKRKEEEADVFSLKKQWSDMIVSELKAVVNWKNKRLTRQCQA